MLTVLIFVHLPSFFQSIDALAKCTAPLKRVSLRGNVVANLPTLKKLSHFTTLEDLALAGMSGN